MRDETRTDGMRNVSDVVFPRASDIVNRLDELIRLAKREAAFPVSPDEVRQVVTMPQRLSFSDLALSYLASDQGGMVQLSFQKLTQTVAAGAIWSQPYINPPGWVTVFLDSIGIWASFHSPLIDVTLTLDGLSVPLNAHQLTADVDIEFSKYIPIRHHLILDVVNNSALPTDMTLELPIARVASHYFNDYWMPAIRLAYENLIKIPSPPS